MIAVDEELPWGWGGVYQRGGEEGSRQKIKAEGRCLVCRTAGVTVDCSWNGEWLWGATPCSWSRKDEVITDRERSVSSATISNGCGSWTSCGGSGSFCWPLGGVLMWRPSGNRVLDSQPRAGKEWRPREAWGRSIHRAWSWVMKASGTEVEDDFNTRSTALRDA